MKNKNVWNVLEIDENKVACTAWEESSVYIIDRNDSTTLLKPKAIKDKDSSNKYITDLWPIPSFHPHECPFLVKRGLKKIEIVDIRHMQSYTLFEDLNNKWGYNKVSVIDRDFGRFSILYMVQEGKTDNIIKRYDFPAVFEEGLKKITNLRHK